MTDQTIYRHTRCIQCLSDSPLTEEHVFADGAGGTITAYILCTTCNGHFGANVDSPYLRQPMIELARNALRIGGRRNVIPQPLKGPYVVPGPIGESTIKLDIDFKPRVMPQVEDVVITEDGAISITMVIDSQDREKIPGIVRSKFERFFKSERGMTLAWSEKEQEHAITSTIDKYMRAPDNETPVGVLPGQMTMDLGTLFLEAAKAAFEMAAIEDGEAFVDSPEAANFRELLARVIKGRIEDLFGFVDMLKAFRATPLPADSQVALGIQWLTDGRAIEHHVAILNGRHVVISMFGDGYIFSNLRPASGQRAIYVNNAVTGSIRCIRD